jgi:hypothetical protein
MADDAGSGGVMAATLLADEHVILATNPRGDDAA